MKCFMLLKLYIKIYSAFFFYYHKQIISTMAGFVQKCYTAREKQKTEEVFMVQIAFQF